MSLQPKEAGVLRVLLEARVRDPDAIVEKEEFFRKLWPGVIRDDEGYLDDCLKRAVFALKKKLAEKDSIQFIKTYSKRGYQFVVDVRVVFSTETLPTVRFKLAVLPFRSLARKKQPEYFIDGLTYEIITQLNRLNPEQLGVIAAVSVMRYKNSKKTVKQIGKELGVQYLVAGQVFQSGTNVRLSAQLIHIADESQVWAETYERKLDDITVFLRQVCLDIAREIKIKLVPHEQARLDYLDPWKAEASKSYLHGRYLWNKRTPKSLQAAISLFEKAIALDSRIAPAHSALADCYAVMASQSWIPPKQACAKAKMAATNAIEIDPNSAEPHAALGFILSVFERQWSGAVKEFQTALRLNSNYPTTHHWNSFYLAAMNRMPEAIEQMKKAQELDPLSRIINTNVGTMLYWAREYDDAIEQYDQVLALDSDFWYAHWMRGMAHDEKRQYREAAAAQHRAMRYFPGQSPLLAASLSRSLALSRNWKEAQSQLKHATRPTHSSALPHYHIATAHAALGDADAAFHSLLESGKANEMWVSFIQVDPKMDSLRKDACYDRLRRMLSL